MNGQNEGMVAQAVKGIRDKVYISTKIKGGTKSRMLRNIEESLRALQTDHVDVLHLHSLSSGKQVMDEKTRQVMAQARQEGKARFLAVSTHKGEAEVLDAVVQDPEKLFDVVTVAYNFKKGKEVKEAIARAAKGGVGIVAMKTQAGGYKTKELGEISPHQAALKWVLQDTNVAAAIPAMVNLDQIEEDTQVMKMKFSKVDEQILRRYGYAIEPYYCQSCGLCSPGCPFGVDICEVNRCLMYAEGYCDIELARAAYASLPETRSAAACEVCKECTAACVNGLDIGQKMRKALAILT
jgi:predicted aldo/keto reductase-like oxidoreductase